MRRLDRWFCLLCFPVGSTLPTALAFGSGGGESEIRLIVRGDDLGSSHAANQACLQAYRNGIMRTVEVMVPTPWFPEAVRLLRENPGLDVGVHLTLTSEWDNLKWRPLTAALSLTDGLGFFLPLIWPSPGRPEAGVLREAGWSAAEIEQELRAQIRLARQEIPQVSHLSGHMGLESISPVVAGIVRKLAIESGLDLDPVAFGVREFPGYHSAARSGTDKTAAFCRALEHLQPGTYLFVDHPGLDTPEMRAIHHPGYEDVAVDRQGVTDCWTSPTVLETIRRRMIRLIAYADLPPAR